MGAYEAGTQIGPYRITAMLGAGGMGQVYAAEDPRLGRQVALKLLAPEFTEHPDRVSRFEREARAASALNHPNIVTIHDIGESDGGRFIVMEQVDGQTIREVMGSSPSFERVSFETVADVGRQVAEALETAHAAGIVHRDIKPENIMLRRDGYVKVLDFGLVRLIPAHPSPPENEGAGATTLAQPLGTDGTAVSQAGALMGTASYMSPEQALGQPVSRASDLFSFGVMLYEMATGVHPFASPSASSMSSILTAIVSQTPVAPRRIDPGLPDLFHKLLLQLLEKDAHLRPSAADVRSALAELATGAEAPTVTMLAAKSHTVGREPHLETLQQGFDSACSTQGMLLVVSGEPGIGKTELVEEFLRTLSFGGQAVRIARGRCSERLEGTGAYLPFLEALDSLLQAPQAAEVSRAMKTLAPTWFRQLAPGAAPEGAADAPLASSEEILKREMASFFGEISGRHPVVLFLDDLHWADVASVDMLSYLGARFDALRLLVVGSVRPTELMLAEHPFQQVKLQLTSRGACREIALGFLSEADIERYLSLELPGSRFAGELASLIHAKTEGSPLYMANILQHLKEQRIIEREQDRWTLRHSIPELERELPESIRSMIQVKIDQLGEEDRSLLVAASVEGPEFDSAIVSLALGMDTLDVEDRLDRLENVHAFVRPIREHEFPDGTLSVRYQFVHVLYQNALYGSLRPARRAALSAAVAEALIVCHGDQRDTVASELGMLLESARDYRRASEFFQLAAQRAEGLYAHHEAILLARRGLETVAKLPDSPERGRQELDLQTTLGPALMATQGWSSPDVQATYDRARELCQHEEPTPEGFSVLRGLWQFYLVRGKLETARELADQLYQLARHLDDPRFQPESHRAKGETALMLGDFAAARDELEQGIACYDPQAVPLPEDPGAICPSMASWALWMLGDPDQALERSAQGVARARAIASPFCRTLTAYFAAGLHLFRGDLDEALEQANEIADLSEEHGFGLMILVGGIVRNWALVKQQSTQADLELMRGNLDACLATGAKLMWPFFLYLTADAYGGVGRPEDGLELLTIAQDTIAETGERWCSAEIWRLKGELLEATGSPKAEVEACYREAIEVSRQQQAKSLELRAATALARL